MQPILEAIQGSWVEAYNLVLSYVVQLLKIDLPARTILVGEADESFLRLF